jgi:hypothetical protein
VFAKLRVIAVFDFVKIILVELAYKRGKIGVLEETWEDRFSELVHVLCAPQMSQERMSINRRRTFTTKQSPRGPHDTTGWNNGSSSIL